MRQTATVLSLGTLASSPPSRATSAVTRQQAHLAVRQEAGHRLDIRRELLSRALERPSQRLCKRTKYVLWFVLFSGFFSLLGAAGLSPELLVPPSGHLVQQLELLWVRVLHDSDLSSRRDEGRALLKQLELLAACKHAHSRTHGCTHHGEQRSSKATHTHRAHTAPTHRTDDTHTHSTHTQHTHSTHTAHTHTQL